MRAMRKKLKIFTLPAANLLHIRTGKYKYYYEDFCSTIFQFEPEQKKNVW